MNYESYQNLFGNRLDQLRMALREVELPRTPSYAPLIYLKNLLVDSDGHLSGLRVEIVEKITNSAGRAVRMSYDLSESAAFLKLDYRLIDALDKAKETYGSANRDGVLRRASSCGINI